MKRWTNVILVLAVGLSGCGGEPEAAPPVSTPSPSPTRSSVPPATTPPPSPRTTPSPSPTYTPPTGPLRVVKKKQTTPGARLRFGRKAIVPIRYYDHWTKRYTEGVIGVSPGPIRRIPATELEGNYDAESRARLRGKTAYYSRIVITNESGNDLSGIVVPRFRGLRRGGQRPDLLLLGGDISSCPENVSAPDSFDHKGATWVTCHFEASSPARPVRVIEYDEPPYGLEVQGYEQPPPQFNQYYDLGGIRWR